MKHFFKPRLVLALALSGAVLPLALVGCGGGGLLNANPTPTTPAGTALPELNFTFNSGQTARFFGGTVSPTGVVNAQITIAGAAAAPLQIPPGTYPTTGTLNPTTRDFTLTQGAGSAYNFGVAGKVPSASDTGNFVFTAQNGATENGEFEAGTVIVPPGNPNALSLTPNLTFSGTTTNTDFINRPWTSFTSERTGNTRSIASLIQTDVPTAFTTLLLTGRENVTNAEGNRREISMTLRSTTNGQREIGISRRFVRTQKLKIAPSGGSNFPSDAHGSIDFFGPFSNGLSSVPSWKATGTATVLAVTANSITLELTDVKFKSNSGSTQFGDFTLSGTIVGTNLPSS